MNFKLAQYREKSPYTQADIARIAGVSAKTEWNWEQSKSYIRDKFQKVSLAHLPAIIHHQGSVTTSSFE